MTSYAPGTPLSVIKKMDKKFYGNKRPKDLPKNAKPQVQPTKPTGTKADPLKKVKTPQPVTKAVRDYRKQLNAAMPMPTQAPTPAPTVAPRPRPHIDEGFGNGPGRGKMPLVKPIANAGTKAGSLSPRGAVTGGASTLNPKMMNKGGNVSKRADGAAKKGKTKGRYI